MKKGKSILSRKVDAEMTTGRGVMWVLLALIIFVGALRFSIPENTHRKPNHLELIEILKEAHREHGASLDESFRGGFLLFTPYGDGFIHLQTARRSSAMNRLYPDWSASQYAHKDGNVIWMVFRGWKRAIRETLDGSVSIGDDALNVTVPLKAGFEVGLFKWRDDWGVYLHVVDDNPRRSVFALGVRESPKERKSE